METAATQAQTADPVTQAAANPFVAPRRTHPIASVGPRAHVAVTGIVVRVQSVRWVGGPVLEVDLRDETGTLRLAFLGRTRIAGVQAGAVMTAAGAVGRRDGEPLLLNPWLWLAGSRVEPSPRTAPALGATVRQEVAKT